ncbi:hypothetical protein Micbo1qcDRAFT_218257 [Microdochium bolleyi]|uniref:Uncharacterized protein n=1 Tax=Microdochium bolleyi TaxID=196109 RepID=A0A136IQ55_9PEZI|nr:hypothetical protein Micbo1qcDRAFT_218257 [Microdochium bolleyi]
MGRAEHNAIPLETRHRVGSSQSNYTHPSQRPQRYVFQGLPVSRGPKWRVILPMFVDWLMTVAVALAIFGVLFFYSEGVDIMDRSAKRVYNGIITGLSIFLGLVVSAGFNETMLTMRWYFMSERYLSIQKIEKILQVENLKEMIMLACRTTRLKLQAAVLAWVLLVVASQIAVAALGLAYGLEVVGEKALIDTSGSVVAPDMSQLVVVQGYDDNNTTTSANSSSAALTRNALEYAANSYGLVSLAYGVANQSALPKQGQLRDATDPLLFCTGATCTYVFYERAAPAGGQESLDKGTTDKSWRLVAATERSITVSSTCTAWKVTTANWTEDQPVNNLALQDSSGSGRVVNITFPVIGASNQTTFATHASPILLRGSSGSSSSSTNNTDDPYTQLASRCTAESGCAFISALEYTARSAAWFYTCLTNTSAVANAAHPGHEVALSIRNLAAAGIALGLDLSNGTDSGLAPGSSTRLRSMQIYPARSPVTPSTTSSSSEGNAAAMAASLTRYAAGIIAVAAEMGPPRIIPGAVPVQGVTLKVEHWLYVMLILQAVVGFQLLLSMLAAFVAVRKVVIPPGGPLAQAQIFRPIAGFLSSNSAALAGESSSGASSFRGEVGGKAGSVRDGDDTGLTDRARLSRWRYMCVWVESEGKYDLYFEEDPSTAAAAGVYQHAPADNDEMQTLLLPPRGPTAPVSGSR